MQTVSTGVAVVDRILQRLRTDCRVPRTAPPFRGSRDFRRSESQHDLPFASKAAQSSRRVFASGFRIFSWPAPETILVYRPDRQRFAQFLNLYQKQKHYPSVTCENCGKGPCE